ncbi:putative NAD(P)/FAD-binding protein YdhS [Kibdelosporangium banguiense]|uniref:NAD(P)/FAD-binding protein YdhS n=1 Tax=Kibdelosporangium banguiense TaxID=1365924 RepID=A0ABS4TZ48_9PSEU|nr:FAD/NAD(P)-binding protein [Kibdelosporangium banguiense]MBP2329689.1 putative NAD(P)/FAD-binding protein YdhS [Kibdelosporangium banguiense]
MKEHRICIVGMGPRGLSVLERLCSNRSPDERLVIHLADPAEHGPGAVWNTKQPTHFLMNTVCSQVTVFTDESVRMEGPVRIGPSLYEWSRTVASTASPGTANDAIRSEARALGPDSYATRAFYGHYLMWALDEVIRRAPSGVRVVHHRQLAVEVTQESTEWTVRLADGEVLSSLNAVVLAQGHLPAQSNAREQELRAFAATNNLLYMPPGNPGNADLSSVEPGEPVLLLGLGLNFFDHLATLTTARGGTFVRHGGVLVYRPSGEEPSLYAGSRRGLPLHARGENQKGAHGRHLPVVLSADVVQALRSQPVDFRTDLWPLIAKEVETVYYTTALSPMLSGDELARFASRYRECAPEEETALLDEYHVGSRWDWAQVENPLSRMTFSSPEHFRTWLLRHLRTDVEHATQGNVRGPVKAALDVLRDLRNEIRAVVDHGGLHGRSHRDDLERWFSPLNAFLSIGPPARRIEEMAALISAGVLTVLGPGTTVRADDDTGTFVAASDVVRTSVSVRVVVDARMASADIRTSDDELLQRLLASGLCRTHRVPDADGGLLETGGLDVTPRPGRVISADGVPAQGLYALGVPTESVHWATAVGIRPCSDSAILGDADAIARAILERSA